MPPAIYQRDNYLETDAAEFEVAGTIVSVVFRESSLTDADAGWPYTVNLQIWDRCS